VAGCEAEGTAFPLSTLHENRMTKMTSTTTTLAATTYLRCRYRRVKAASFDKPDSAWGALHGSGGRRATLANKEPEGRTGRLFSSWPSRAEATMGGRGRLEGGVFCAWSNSSSLTLSWGAVGCGTSGTCVAGAATARTADGRFLGSCRRGLVEFCLHRGRCVPRTHRRHARQSWPLVQGHRRRRASGRRKLGASDRA